MTGWGVDGDSGIWMYRIFQWVFVGVLVFVPSWVIFLTCAIAWGRWS